MITIRLRLGITDYSFVTVVALAFQLLSMACFIPFVMTPSDAAYFALNDFAFLIAAFFAAGGTIASVPALIFHLELFSQYQELKEKEKLWKTFK